MTAMPEAKLAREAELCYATLALATDYDCWHESEADVSVDAVVKVLQQNARNARVVVAEVARISPLARTCHCGQALDHAIITDKTTIPHEIQERMKTIFGRVL